MFRLTELKTENEREPLGVEDKNPAFSWKLEGDARGIRQKNYRLKVFEADRLVWDSGIRESDASFSVFYEGEELKPCTLYRWTLSVTEEKGGSAENGSFFETGLMDGSLKAWQGARFIGGGDEDLPFSASISEAFTAEISVRIPGGSGRAAFLFGANDPRLMDRRKNILGTEAAKDSSYMAAELKLPGEGAPGELRIYRAGYTPADRAEVPLYCFTVPEDVLSEADARDEHIIGLELCAGLAVFSLDRRVLTVSGEKQVNLNPSGKGGDYTCYPLLCDTGFLVPAGQTAEFGPLVIRNYRRPNNVLFRGFPEGTEPSGGVLTVSGGENGAKIIGALPETGTPILRKRFPVGRGIRSARVYVTARGIYNLYLNGKKVNEGRYFEPGLTQYNRTHMYQIYDVTELLRSGEDNVLAAELSEGWWSGAMSYNTANWNFFGDRSSLLLRLRVNYEDGSREDIISDESWKFSGEGPTRYGSLFEGEKTDLTRTEFLNWTGNDFCDDAWKNAVSVPLNAHTAYFETEEEKSRKPGREYDFGWEPEFICSAGDFAGVAEKLTALSVSEPLPGVFVYDMGQNLAGIPEIDLPGTVPGTEVTIRYAEILYPDLPEYESLKGTLMVENLRAALVTDHVILNGKPLCFSPRFTFHGYRYLEITGLPEALPCEAVRSLALSSVRTPTASFSCSDHRINQLFRNISWSFRDNFISIPTDCPQRNERMGWSGDLSLFSHTAVLMGDITRFLRRQARALRDTQGISGRFQDIAPVGGGFGGTLWGSVGCTMPYENYMQTGDIRILREQADAMFRYLSFLTGTRRADGIVDDGPLGDWLGPQVYMTEAAFLWQCYYIYDLKIGIRTAELLSREKEKTEFEALLSEAEEALERVYFDPATHRTLFTTEKEARGLGLRMGPPDEKRSAEKVLKSTASGRFLMDTQTSYAVPLGLGLLRGDALRVAEEYLKLCVERENADESGVIRPPYSLMTGFIGTAWISKALSDGGFHETAYRLLENESYPSWLYSVKNGATTIWERLDSFTRENGFGGNNSMNSFNHYSFGAVGAWLLETAAGIHRGNEAAEFYLAPVPDPSGHLTELSASLDTVRGRIGSSWRKEGTETVYRFSVPGNLSLKTELLIKPGQCASEGGVPLKLAEGVRELSCDGECLSFVLGSGAYEIRVS